MPSCLGATEFLGAGLLVWLKALSLLVQCRDLLHSEKGCGPPEQESPAPNATRSLIANLPPSEGGKATVEGAQTPSSMLTASTFLPIY